MKRSTTIAVVLKPGIEAAKKAVLTLRDELPQLRFLAEQQEAEALELEVLRSEDDIDLCLAFGGDGTMIHAASLFQSKIVPLLGFNLGKLGFLSGGDVRALRSTVEAALEGKLQTSDRMRLDAEVWVEGKMALGHRVLNDAVVAQLALARVATYRVEIDGEEITHMRGDGFIVSTPTGSTAYSLAAGGAILAPGLQALAITPICPHSLTQRPLVVSPQSQVAIELISDSEVFATLDGFVGREFSRGNRLCLKRAPTPTRILMAPEDSYYQRLRTKLGWGDI